MKTNDTIINVDEHGRIEFIGDTCPLNLPLGKIRRRRLSTIRPERFAKRLAFLFCRLAGDRGRVAQWTRTWAGPWRCRILSTGQTEVFDLRQAAVDWEMEIVSAPKFDL